MKPRRVKQYGQPIQVFMSGGAAYWQHPKRPELEIEVQDEGEQSAEEAQEPERRRNPILPSPPTTGSGGKKTGG